MHCQDETDEDRLIQHRNKVLKVPNYKKHISNVQGGNVVINLYILHETHKDLNTLEDRPILYYAYVLKLPKLQALYEYKK